MVTRALRKHSWIERRTDSYIRKVAELKRQRAWETAIDDALVRNTTGHLSGPLFQTTAYGGGNLTQKTLKTVLKYKIETKNLK
jgi:hypothetical protein